jgi:serine/threonine protein kinase
MYLNKNQLLDNKYKVIDFIDSGGFGEVYLVSDESRGIKVALKVMPVEAGFDVLEREAKAVMQLNHPNVVKILDFNRIDDLSYIVMEYLPEGNLHKVLLKRADHIGEPEFVGYALQMLHGLQEINKRIIHRDLKPQNILYDGINLKITDFGLSKYIEDATRSNSFKGAGTYAYMAPETWEQQRATPATDIYSLGIIFYEMLVLRLPFQASTPIEYRKEHLFTSIPHVKDRRPELSIKLDEIVGKMMAKDASARYKTADEVMIKLSELDNIEVPNAACLAIVERATAKLTELEAKELERKKKQELIDEETRKIDLKMKELLSGFDKIIGGVNENLERAKISISKPNNYGLDLWHNWREYSFLGKTVEVRFFTNYLEDKELNQNGVFAAGYMRIRAASEYQHGFNLLLMRGVDDLYGKWHIGEVRQSALVRRTHRYEPYALNDFTDFKDNFLIHFRGAMHSTVISLSNNVNEEFVSLITKMVE